MSETVTEPDGLEQEGEPLTDPDFDGGAIEDHADDPADPEAFEGAPPLEQGPGVDISEALKKIEKRAASYRQAVYDNLGEEAAALVECELCHPDIPGFHFSTEVWGGETDVQKRLVDALKHAAPPDYRRLPGYEQCPSCGGEGKGETGSKAPGKEIVSCRDCKGNGYLAPAGAHVAAAPSSPDGSGELAADLAPVQSADVDPFGSPRILEDGRDNPNFGRMPQFKDPSLP